jgi:hypothetical protein
MVSRLDIEFKRWVRRLVRENCPFRNANRLARDNDRQRSGETFTGTFRSRSFLTINVDVRTVWQIGYRVLPVCPSVSLRRDAHLRIKGNLHSLAQSLATPGTGHSRLG